MKTPILIAVVLRALCGEVSAMPIEQFADGVPAAGRQVLVDLYQSAAARIQQAVLHPTGRTFDARRFNRARAAQLSRQIDEVLTSVRGFTVAWTARHASFAFQAGLQTAVSQLRSAGLSDADLPVRGGMSQIDRRTVAVIAADIATDLDAALGQQAKAAQRFLRSAAQSIAPDSEISRVVGRAAITGDMRAAVREMRGLLNARQIDDYRAAGSQLIAVGRAQMTVRSYAEMLLRTRLREATVHGRHERLLANGRDLVSIVGRLSTNFCTAYLGRVFSISGTSSVWPALSELPGGGPPFHPNCSKSTRAYIEGFATARQKRQAAMTDPRLVTTDAGAAQAVFDRKGELYNVERRYGTVGAENL